MNSRAALTACDSRTLSMPSFFLAASCAWNLMPVVGCVVGKRSHGWVVGISSGVIIRESLRETVAPCRLMVLLWLLLDGCSAVCVSRRSLFFYL